MVIWVLVRIHEVVKVFSNVEEPLFDRVKEIAQKDYYDFDDPKKNEVELFDAINSALFNSFSKASFLSFLQLL